MNIYITSDAHTKLWTTIESIGTEVGGFGYATMAKAGDLIWSDTFLVPQEVSHGGVEFDGGGIAAAVDRAADDGLLGQPEFVWVSWHSHHTLGAFWSSTDEECIRTYANAGIHSLLSFVGCHDHKYKLRYDMFGVKHHGVEVPQVTMDEQVLLADPADTLFAGIYDSIAKNVRKSTPKPTTTKYAQNKPAEQTQTTTKNVVELISFEIRELMEEGLTYKDAKDIVESGEYYVGPTGLVNAWEGSD